MHQLQIFKNENFGEIRTLEINKEIYFVGKDVADILGYQNSSKALFDHVDEEDKLNNESLSSLGQRGGWLINESGLYSLVLSSKLPTAKQFKRWVTSEVLPSIRKTGSYTAKPELSPQLQVLINLELQQKEQEKQLAIVSEKVDSIKEIVALSPTEWRKETTALLNKMATALGGYDKMSELRNESYKLLDERFGVDLQRRLVNKRQRMAENGACKTSRDKLNQLDVIGDDKKLIEGYISIIKEMSIKYGAKIA